MNNVMAEPHGMNIPERQETNVTTQESLMRANDGQFLRHLIDNKAFLKDVYLKLSGKIKNPVDGSMIILRPKLNQEGIGWVLAELSMFTDKIFSTSYYSTEEINRDMEEFELALVRHLFAHYKEFELDIIADLDMIRLLVSHTVQACLKKSQNAVFFKGFSQSTQHTEVMSDRPAQRKEGVLGKIRQGLTF